MSEERKVEVSSAPPLIDNSGVVHPKAISSFLQESDLRIGGLRFMLDGKMDPTGTEKLVLFGFLGEHPIVVLIPRDIHQDAGNLVHGYEILEMLTKEDFSLPDTFEPNRYFFEGIERTKQRRPYPAAIAKVMIPAGSKEIPVCIVERAEGMDASAPSDETLLPRYLKLLALSMEYFTRINNKGLIAGDINFSKIDRWKIDFGINQFKDAVRILDVDLDRPAGATRKIKTLSGQTKALTLLMYYACGGIPGGGDTDDPERATRNKFDDPDKRSYPTMHQMLMRYFDAMFYRFSDRVPQTPEQLGKDLGMLADMFLHRDDFEVDYFIDLISREDVSISIKSAAGDAIELHDFEQKHQVVTDQVLHEVYGGDEKLVVEKKEYFRLHQAEYRVWVLESEMKNLEKRLRAQVDINAQLIEKLKSR